MSARKKTSNGLPQLPGFDIGALTETQALFLTTVTKARRRYKSRQWKGWDTVPPGSLLESIISEFELKTNIALEIPFGIFLHYASLALIEAESVINLGNQRISPEFWTIVLANSGGGKTWSEKEIKKGIGWGDMPLLESGAVSSAKFIEQLADRPRALWIRDEFFQLMRAIEKDSGPHSETKDYLLRAYDGSTIKRQTKQGEVVVESPCLSILGLTATDPFIAGMTPESLTDGFAQRLGIINAKPDPKRKMEDYPIWEVDSNDWKSGFERLKASILTEYTVDESGIEAYNKMFKQYAGESSIDESFYRRILYRAHKYALVYHLIRGAGKNQHITDEDYGWAGRLIEWQLSDAAEVIDQCAGSELSKAVDAAERVIRKLQEAGKPVTPRALVSGTRLIQNAATAKFVMEVLGIAR